MDRLRDWTREDLERELLRLRERASVDAPSAVAPGRSVKREQVAWRALVASLTVLERELGAAEVERRLEAVGRDAAALRRMRGWVSWPEYESTISAFDDVAIERLRAAGAGMFQTPVLRFFGLGVSTVPDLDLALRWIGRISTGPGGMLFRGSRLEVRRREPSLVTLTFVPPPGGRAPRAFVGLAEGVLASLPSVASDPSASVRTVRSDDAVRFEIRHAPRGRLRRARALASALRPAPVGDALDEAREALAERNEELRRRIVELEESERERGALSAELAQAERMDAIGRFAGGVAHDFNNLLAVILAQLDMLARRAGELETSPNLHAIERAGARASALCRQLLAVGGREPMRLEAVDLRDLVNSRRELIEAAAGEPVRVRFEIGEAPAWVEADLGSLERVLFDLVANAREAMPDGGELTIGVEAIELDERPSSERSRSGPHVELRVCDTGEGMSADVRRRAVEPFFTTREELGRRGLGLAAAYGVTRQLGGALRLASRPGEGTDARILLPRWGPS